MFDRDCDVGVEIEGLDGDRVFLWAGLSDAFSGDVGEVDGKTVGVVGGGKNSG